MKAPHIVLTMSFTLSVLLSSLSNAAGEAHYHAIERLEFNRLAAEQFIPVFWREDINKDGSIQPDEISALIGFGGPHENELTHWVKDGQFTPAFAYAYQRLLNAKNKKVADSERIKLVKQELAQGRTTLVETDMSKASAADVAVLKHLTRVAKLIENIYQQQKGTYRLDVNIPLNDLSSRMLFHRNQSPFCEAPNTGKNPKCNALAKAPQQLSGLYPAAIQGKKEFCEYLAQTPNGNDLMDHFSVVMNGDKPGTFKSVPYNIAYKKDMGAIANELDAAADALEDNESAFRNYLRVAAQSFRTNDWEPANRAWVAMNATNSKWYARIAPDEVYYEPCAWKAGFALQLAHINSASLAWQEKLEPLKNEMERALAEMAGAPYKARDVKFKVPDFIDVVLNAGDQRNALSATIGQSLPNWGPVAESGGRTVAMTNLFQDADSLKSASDVDASMFCPKSNTYLTKPSEDSLISALLHEVAHNLGPAHDYTVNGKNDRQAFGGPLASTLEELKAETSSMFLANWLVAKKVMTQQQATEINVYQVTWDFGHISRGMYAADGRPQNYSQLAAIQLGWILDHKAATWNPQTTAANGKDVGCIELDVNALPAAIQSLEARVLQIKARADKDSADQLLAEYVDGKNDYAKLKDVIAERWRRNPRASLVYSIRY